MTKLSYPAPTPLWKGHDAERFDCGKPSLNDFLRREALPLQQAGTSRTFVVASEGRIVGFYSLSAVEIVTPSDPPIPAMRMPYLAVDRAAQGMGLGRALLRDAVSRTLHESDDLNVRAFFADAIDDEASRFFVRFGMTPSPETSARLYYFF